MDFRHIPTNFILYITLYGGVTIASLIACLYICLRKGNAFKPDVSPPLRLRRWAAALFALTFLGHIWWLFFRIYSGDTNSVAFMVLTYLDCLTLFTTIPGTMFAMLQDRKRHVWPIVIATIPFAVLKILHIVNPNGYFQTFGLAYILLVYVILPYIWDLLSSNTDVGCATTMPTWRTRRYG